MPKKSKPARGLTARGSKGGPRNKLAQAAGYRSDSELTEQFSEKRHKQVRQLQQALADLATSLVTDEAAMAAVGSHYAALLDSLLGRPAKSNQAKPEKPTAATNRSEKQSAVATQALRQMVLEALETPLAVLPSLLADGSLSDQDKLSRISVYTAALEAVYDPLDLDPIGDPGDEAAFDPKLHESAEDLSKGDACVVRQIGLRNSDGVLRKAVVVQGE